MRQKMEKKYKSDIEIAQEATMLPIKEVAAKMIQNYMVNIRQN